MKIIARKDLRLLMLFLLFDVSSGGGADRMLLLGADEVEELVGRLRRS